MNIRNIEQVAVIVIYKTVFINVFLSCCGIGQRYAFAGQSHKLILVSKNHSNPGYLHYTA